MENLLPLRLGILLFVLPAVGCAPRKWDLGKTKQAGNAVVQGVEKYHADQGSFPAQLDDLCPKYLTEIPEPRWGLGKWEYKADKKGFDLRVNESTRTGDKQRIQSTDHRPLTSTWHPHQPGPIIDPATPTCAHSTTYHP